MKDLTAQLRADWELIRQDLASITAQARRMDESAAAALRYKIATERVIAKLSKRIAELEHAMKIPTLTTRVIFRRPSH